MKRPKKALAVVSGGLDSVTLAHALDDADALGGLISFDYGQRHRRELNFARECAERLKTSHELIDLRGLRGPLSASGSTLVAAAPVPHGHYAHDNMKQTVVPNRNAIMLAIAFGVAAARAMDAVAIAVHGGDHYIYPDCRPEFLKAFDMMQRWSLEGLWSVELFAPFQTATKADIANTAQLLGVPLDRTWSCYEGGSTHCGRCGTCVERLEAFALAGLSDKDRTTYRDQTFWRQECERKGTFSKQNPQPRMLDIKLMFPSS